MFLFQQTMAARAVYDSYSIHIYIHVLQASYSIGSLVPMPLPTFQCYKRYASEKTWVGQGTKLIFIGAVYDPYVYVTISTVSQVQCLSHCLNQDHIIACNVYT